MGAYRPRRGSGSSSSSSNNNSKCGAATAFMCGPASNNNSCRSQPTFNSDKPSSGASVQQRGTTARPTGCTSPWSQVASNPAPLQPTHCRRIWPIKSCPVHQPTRDKPDPRKNRLKVAFGRSFSPRKYFFHGLGVILYRKQTTRNTTQSNSWQTPC